MRHLLKTADQVGAANRSAAMLAHQPLYKRRADVLILDERADALGFVIGEGGVLLAECRANLIKTEHVFFAFVEERADPIAVFKESIRELESWPRHSALMLRIARESRDSSRSSGDQNSL